MFSYYILLYSLFLVELASCQTVSIQSLSAWKEQRACALECLGGIFDDGGNQPPSGLASGLQCETATIENSCFCRRDLQTSASSWMSSYLPIYCSSNTEDAKIAFSIYEAYCTTAGFAHNAATTAATGTPNIPATVTATVTAMVTVTRVETMVVDSGQQRLMSPMEAIAQIAGYRR